MIHRYHDLPAWFWPLVAREGSVLLHSAKPDDAEHVSWLYADPVETLELRDPEGTVDFLAALEAHRERGAWLAGYLAYEAGYALVGVDDPPDPGIPLAWFGVYEGAWRFDHLSGGVSAVGQARPAEPDRPTAATRIDLGPFGLSESEYRDKLARIYDYLSAGDTYQVNFTDRFEGELHGEPVDAYRALVAGQPVSFGAYVDTGGMQIASLSPELFFRVEAGAGAGRTITARPMKGTAPRGRDAAEDAALADAMRADPKSRAENVMIVDLLRNDLGRICEHGSVRVPRLFDVERYRTVQQMTSTVEGTLRGASGVFETFEALFPCGSVTGAPKRRTMEIVRELERVPRGVYTGAIGHAGPDGSMAFSVAIRTLVVRGDRVTLGAGGGIVADSDPAAEYRECALKAEFAVRESEVFELIETLRWEDGYPFLAQHLERLAASCEYFGYPRASGELHRALLERAEDFPAGSPHRVGVRLRHTGDFRITAEPLAEPPPEPPGEPLLVAIAADRVDSSDPFRRHKTTRRALYEAATARARRDDLADILFLNERDELAEGAISNVFVEIEGELLTPRLDAGALPGVCRQHVLGTDPRAREATLTLNDLERADAIYLANALRGMRKVALVPLPDLASAT